MESFSGQPVGPFDSDPFQSGQRQGEVLGLSEKLIFFLNHDARRVNLRIQVPEYRR